VATARPHETFGLAPLRQLANQAFSRASGAPLREGNAIRLLKDASENYPAWLAAIDAARERISLEMYIVHNDAVGRQFRDALIARAGTLRQWGAKRFRRGAFEQPPAEASTTTALCDPEVRDHTATSPRVPAVAGHEISRLAADAASNQSSIAVAGRLDVESVLCAAVVLELDPDVRQGADGSGGNHL
jgi:hypothetical protein